MGARPNTSVQRPASNSWRMAVSRLDSTLYLVLDLTSSGELTRSKFVTTTSVVHTLLSLSRGSYKGNLIKVERSREKQIVDFNTGSPWETVTLTALGRNRQLYTQILHEGTLTAVESVVCMWYIECDSIQLCKEHVDGLLASSLFVSLLKLERWHCRGWRVRLSCTRHWGQSGDSLATPARGDLSAPSFLTED